MRNTRLLLLFATCSYLTSLEAQSTKAFGSQELLGILQCLRKPSGLNEAEVSWLEQMKAFALMVSN